MPPYAWKRLRNALVRSCLGLLMSSLGSPSSTMTPPSMKMMWSKERGDDLPQQLTEVFREMLADGTVRQIVSRYLDDPGHYLDGLEDSAHA